MTRKNALGKGLGALIEETPENSSPTNQDVGFQSTFEVNINDVETNPFQPRANFDEEALEELAISIKEIGIIQPITVRQVEGSQTYQLISGERRLKASSKAGLSTIPAYIRSANDQEMLEMVLVENIQREDLDSIEIAMSYQRLMEECMLTQEKVSDRVGKKRATITNYLRLLKLPPEIQLGIREKQISMGHARSIITIEDPDQQLKVYHRIIKEGLSVRKTEELVRKVQEGTDQSQNTGKANNEIPQAYKELRNELREYLNTKVDFKKNTKNNGGKIIIPFQSGDDLERIMTILENRNT